VADADNPVLAVLSGLWPEGGTYPLVDKGFSGVAV
jgi:hypothetical protein